MSDPTIVKINWLSIILVVGALFVFRITEPKPVDNTNRLEELTNKIDSIRNEIKSLDRLETQIFIELNQTYEKIDTASNVELEHILHSLPRRRHHNISK